jgi:hypothetical protein
LWTIYQHAKAYGTRPSVILDIRDPYVAYCLDEAAATFGETVQAELDSLDSSNPKMLPGKRLNHLRRRLGLQQQFRDPGAGKGKQVKF